MALKEKALRRLADKMNAAGIAWAAMGDWALCVQGIGNEWHGFDLLVAEKDAAQADKILTRMGMRHEEPDGASVLRAAYHFDGADIMMTAGLAIAAEGAVYHAVLDADAIGGTQTVLGAQVPTLRQENELTLAVLRGDDKTAAAVAAALKAAGRAADAAAVAETLPESMVQCINKLMEE